MLRQNIFILLLFLGLCCGELLGPESRAKDESSKDQGEGEGEEEDEYAKELKRYMEALKELKHAPEGLPSSIDEGTQARLPTDQDDQSQITEKLESDSKTISQKTVGQINPSWLDTILEMPRHNMEFVDDNPQELLDQLPALEEEEEELTPQQQEAKDLFETAIAKLDRRSPDLRAAILQVKQAAEMGHVPAKIKLAWSYIYGEGVELDIDKARVIFEELVENGVADAHAGMGFLYAVGLSVPVSQAKALVHYTLGAAGGSWRAQMSLAYRHWAGVTLPSSCPRALELYMRVAAKVAAGVSLSGGRSIQRVRLLDEAEGSGSGGTMDTDLIEYYQLLAEKGDVQAQVGLGQLHLQGGRGVTLDVSKALHYFTQAARANSAVANAFLGKIYLEGGDGIKADNDTALRYFRKAAELNNPVGQSGLGIMYLEGRGVPRDTTAAFKYFTMAANQGWVEGQLQLGLMYFAGNGVRRDFKQANKYLSLASQSGHVLAFYHLAHMHAQGLGVMRECTTATELFKNVCERGEWGSRLMLAQAAWRARDQDSAFLQYMSLAEMGYEVAQSNAAWLLDNGEVQMFSEKERWARAFQLWSRSAAQGYSPARVKLGDYHYYGLGTPVDLEAAAHHYRIASEQQHNAQAMFNLGYMHERGLGLARDLHLAKRCYDLAADASPAARLPAAIALARLNAAVALTSLAHSLAESPLAGVLVGDSWLLANWDLYLLTVLVATLALLFYIRTQRNQGP